MYTSDPYVGLSVLFLTEMLRQMYQWGLSQESLSLRSPGG